MKKNSRMYFSNIVVLLLLPYLITILINGYDMAVLNQKADSETVLPVILALQISSDYEPETIKAQAVIARSNLYRKIGEKESINRNGDQNKKERDTRSEKFFETCRELRDELPSCWSVWEKADKVYEEAVEDTSGQVLTYNGKLKLVHITRSVPGRREMEKPHFIMKNMPILKQWTVIQTKQHQGI